ncbi:SDR family NAD(P)-dependent oxidoreductase [Herbiconiux sp. A18JL235]|uniref:SDR family NAD(P)-dependent oxidoreductase n=1 Tax=Herbiconiux sp. A18JL235 TaxID=3152363 RepID=A0AB39BL54_9MICO
MDRTIVVTGASDGIGAAAARAFAAQGERVVVVGRSPDKTRAVAEGIGAEHHLADFSRLEEVRDLADLLLERHERIDVLANNAGGIMGERTVTVDGYELTFQVNHLAPFLLTTLLLPRMLPVGGRVITTSSVAHRFGGTLDLDDLGSARRYSPERAYGASKLANILFTVELHRRYRADGLLSAAFHPGVVATGFSADSSTALRLLYRTGLSRFIRSPENGAETLLWLADGEEGVHWMSGGYYARRAPARCSKQSRDPALARGLWERSEQLTRPR